MSTAIGCTQILPKVGFVFVFRVEKTYLELKDFNFLCKDTASSGNVCLYRDTNGV